MSQELGDTGGMTVNVGKIVEGRVAVLPYDDRREASVLLALLHLSNAPRIGVRPVFLFDPLPVFVGVITAR
ncbi:hypothetical protein [Nocardia ignorata]|uniref:hypothetical protein n=1 Tax=Nocardia ignorata TaxID=145285 RepID=UPI0008298CCE|nr:hypothetical protein [Nocardia ignorata]